MVDFTPYDGPSKEWLKIEATLPPRPTASSAIDTLAIRSATNVGREQASAAAFAPMRPQLLVKDHTITARDGFALEARSYRPKDVPENEALPVYIHYHGGGFVFGTLSSEDVACGRIVLSLAPRGRNIVVLNVSYRHTPEWKYPVAWDDAVDSFVWLHDNLEAVGGDGARVLLGGISAGARLTASLLVRKSLGLLEKGQDLPDPIGQLLFIPSLVHHNCHGPLLSKLKDRSKASHLALEDAPIIPKKILGWFTELLEVGEAEVDDLKLNPGNVSEAQLEQARGRFPPTVSGMAGYDPLRDDGLIFAKDLAEAGIPTKTHLFHGVPHGFRRFGDRLSASKKWDAAIDEGILWCLSGPKVTGKFEIVLER